MSDLGTKFGLNRRGTILKFNSDGTVLVGIDEVGLQQSPQSYTVPMPLAWAGPDGECIGGGPTRGSSVILSQAQGGQWFIESYIPSRNVFTSKDLMGVLTAGRAVMQVKNGNRLFVDPIIGIQAGNTNQFIHINPVKNLISHNFKMDMKFTEGSRSVDGVIKRDLVENSNRNLVGSTLDSHIYDDSLYTVAFDPTFSFSTKTSGDRVRNPPLVEKRELIYEFAESFNVSTDTLEATRSVDEKSFKPTLDNGRRDSRADTMALGLSFPNHLMETIKGTVVDTFGNILDINRSILPIGRIEKLSLRKNPDKSEAVARIKAQHRKSLAFHMEINVKKSSFIDPSTGADTVVAVPDVSSSSNYSRDRSRWYVDIDKEGQIKFNVPASSETGNIPLLTRYENYSVLLAKQNSNLDPNTLSKNINLQDIYLDNFAGKPGIKLTSSDNILDGYISPIDRITDSPILFGTAFHDITKMCNTFLAGGGPLVAYDSSNTFNNLKPYDKIVSNTITVSGSKANAGGRSGLFNFDGFVSLNVGANTVDRQSLWLDCAGGIVSQIGRDLRGISYAAHLDGDMIIQIGGPGIGNKYDSRFASENDASRAGTFDIRVLNGNGLMTIIRVDQFGLKISTPGRIDFEAEQSINFKSRSDIYLNAESIVCYADSGVPRKVLRKKVSI